MCRTSGHLIQRMSFGRVTHMTCPHAALLPTRRPRPPLIPPHVSLRRNSPEAQVLDLRCSVACSLKQREAFPSSGCDLSVSLPSCPFLFCFPSLKFCLASSGHRSRLPKSQIKAFRDAEAPDSESSTTRLCPLN